mgnify:FL=1
MPVLWNLLNWVPASWLGALQAARRRAPWLNRGVSSMTRRMKSRGGVIQRGVGRGLRFDPGGGNLEYLLGTAEPAVQDVMSALVRPGMVVFDVGANVGFLTLIAARLVGPSGRVVAFEPWPAASRILSTNLRANGMAWVSVVPLALFDQDGPMAFVGQEATTLGRLATTLPPSSSSDNASQQVDAARLDTWIAHEGAVPNVNLRPPDLVKIDVEGAEAAVLRGARQTIRSHQPTLLIELHGTNLEVSSELASLGYQSFVLGQGEVALPAAPTEAFVVAVPQDDRGRLDFARRLCEQARTLR